MGGLSRIRLGKGLRVASWGGLRFVAVNARYVYVEAEEWVIA